MFRRRRDELMAKMGIDPATLQQARGRVQAVMPAQQPAAMADRERLDRIMVAGIEMPATLRSFSIADTQPQRGGMSVHLDLTVEPPGGDPYQVSIDQTLPPMISQTLAADQRLTVKAAADDPQCVMLWNTPHAAGGADPETGRPLSAAPAAPAAEDRITRLEKLHELRSSGALTDQEFEAQKAKILAT
jgi:hypothetical protein